MEIDSAREMLAILKQIRDEVSLITVPLKVNAINSFYQEFLSTDQRKNMYELFNGERDVMEISKEVNCSPRNVQILIKELEDKDLIDIEKIGKGKIPQKSVSKIAIYYARNEITRKE